MLLGYDITDTSITFITDDGVPRSADASHPNFVALRGGLLAPEPEVDRLIELVDTKTAIEGKTFGLVTVGSDQVWYKNIPVAGYLIDKLLRMLAANVEIAPWALLLDKLMRNPSQSVRERLPLFLEQAQMPITSDGHFLAWRLVKHDYWDIYTGHTFKCLPGAVIDMPREQCDANPENTCSTGIHVAAFGYLESYGLGSGDGRRCVLVKINPEHVVSVPTDYNAQKLRVCEASVLREVPKEKVPVLFGPDDHVLWLRDENERVEQWREAVATGDTTLGYNDWVEEVFSSTTWKQAVMAGETDLSFQSWLRTQT